MRPSAHSDARLPTFEELSLPVVVWYKAHVTLLRRMRFKDECQ